MSSETRKEVAQRIVRDACENRRIKQINAFVKEDYARLALTIENELRARDERAAKIAEAHIGHGAWCSHKGDCQMLAAQAIVTAIRNEDTASKPYKQHLMERLKTPEDAGGYLAASLADNADCPEATALAIQDIIEAFQLPFTVKPSKKGKK